VFDNPRAEAVATSKALDLHPTEPNSMGMNNATTQTESEIMARYGIKAFYGEGADRCAPNGFKRDRAVACVRELKAAGMRAVAVSGPELFAAWHVYCEGE
jgi:hypothetical protein